MLQKIKKSLILGSFVLVVLTTIVSFGNENRVYAGSGTTTIPCIPLAQLAINYVNNNNNNSGSVTSQGGRSISVSFITAVPQNLPYESFYLGNKPNPSCYSNDFGKSYTINGSNVNNLELLYIKCTYNDGTNMKKCQKGYDFNLYYSSKSKSVSKPVPNPPPPASYVPTLGSISNPANTKGSSLINTMFSKIFPILYGLLGVIVIALISYAGFLWMSSGGDTQKIGKAKAILTGVVIGVSIIILAYAMSLLAIHIL